MLFLYNLVASKNKNQTDLPKQNQVRIMSRNNNTASTATTGYRLPTFAPPPPSTTPIYFSWIVDGVEKIYSPSAAGVLTYCIPRVHVSVDEDFVKSVMDQFFTTKIGKKATTDICRVDFQPIEGNTNFKRAFVYHTQFLPTTGCWMGHFNAMATRGAAGMWNASSNYPYNMPLVCRITKSIFTTEHEKNPIKVNFIHNGRHNFWLILPNLSPITEIQRELTEQIAEYSDALVGELANLAKAGLPVPNDFNEKVLEHSRVQTAWLSFSDHTQQFIDILANLSIECDRIRAYAMKNGVRTIEFDDEMALMQFEHDEDNAAIEALDEEVERGDF
jgi:hypothetical protein